MKRLILFYLGGFILVAGIAAIGVLLLSEENVACGCTPDPHIFISQAEAENIMAAPIPVEATNIRHDSYKVGNNALETYISFDLPARQTETFLATLPNLLPLDSNPMTDHPTHITNFGAIDGAPTRYEVWVYSIGDDCERYVLVNQDSDGQHGIYLYVECP